MQENLTIVKLRGQGRKKTERANWSELPTTKMSYNIATLNLCLGLPNKKNLVKEIIINEKIDILCLQETELRINFDHNLLSFPGVNYE